MTERIKLKRKYRTAYVNTGGTTRPATGAGKGLSLAKSLHKQWKDMASTEFRKFILEQEAKRAIHKAKVVKYKGKSQWREYVPSETETS